MFTYLQLRRRLRNIVNRAVAKHSPSVILHSREHLPSAVAPVLLPRDAVHVKHALDRLGAKNVVF